MGQAKPIDWEPKEFPRKDEDWKPFKEEVEDFVDEISDRLVATLEYAAKQKTEVARDVQNKGGLGESWEKRQRIFKLLERKTLATSEAHGATL